MSHITHFYHLNALNYVQGPPMSFWQPWYLDDYYDSNLLASNFGKTGTPYMAVIQEYVEALRYRRIALELGSIFAHRLPIQPNIIAGGVAIDNNKVSSSDLTDAIKEFRKKLYGNEDGGPGSIGTGSDQYREGSLYHFIKHRYLPLTTVISNLYSTFDNSNNGASDYGQGCVNFLSYGVFHTDATSHGRTDHLLHRGYKIYDGDPTAIPASGDVTASMIYESVASSHYDYKVDRDHASEAKWLNPLGSDPGDPDHPNWREEFGQTIPNLSKSGAYSWIKSPRLYANNTYNVMEVGPLARMVVTGKYDISGTDDMDAMTNGIIGENMPDHADQRLAPLTDGTVADGHGLKGGVSVLDRIRARALECLYIAYTMDSWLDDLASAGDDAKDVKPIPQEAYGAGMHEAPRGALAHFISIRDYKVYSYQVITPTNWNASPADVNGKNGPIEQALTNPAVPLSLHAGQNYTDDDYVPVEVQRVVNSFDPCIACAVHIVDGRKVSRRKGVSRR
jgi:Ni,Fe-hydrogenase I large subunit